MHGIIPLYLQVCVQCGFGCLAAFSLKGLLVNVFQSYPKNVAFSKFAAQFIATTMLCGHLGWSILALFHCKARMLSTDSAINMQLIVLYINELVWIVIHSIQQCNYCDNAWHRMRYFRFYTNFNFPYCESRNTFIVKFVWNWISINQRHVIICQFIIKNNHLQFTHCWIDMYNICIDWK